MADNSSGSSKQISIEKRLEILNELEVGASVNDLTREYNVTDRSIRRIRQNLTKELQEGSGPYQGAAEKIIEQFSQILEKNEISEDDLYNMDETSLFWKMLPNKTLVSAEEQRAPGRLPGKEKKDRITLEAEQIDRLLHYLEKIRLTQSKIANHVQPIIKYYNSK
ncbi:hypothetical protein ANTRET_LOCUS9383 [Anthophora retusa]